MRTLAFPDPYVTEEMIQDAHREAWSRHELELFDGGLADSIPQLQERFIKVEKGGPEAIEFPNDVVGKIRQYQPDVLVTHFSMVTREMIEAAEQLRAIGVMRGGYENVDVGAATDHGIPVLHTSGRNDNAVAEFTVGFMLSEVKNIARAHAAIKQGRWRRRFSTGDLSFELTGKTVGIVGFGNVGSLVAKKLSRGLEADVLAHDPFVDDETMESVGARPASMEELLEESEIVTLHVRLSEETEGMIGEEELERMKSSAFLINTARAGLIEREALYQALRKREIAGAALDVFWDEPIDQNNPFTHLDNVTLTPHYAGSTVEAFSKSPVILFRSLEAYFEDDDRSAAVNEV